MPRPHAARRISVAAVTALFVTGLLAAPAVYAEPQVTPESVEDAFHVAEAANEVVNQLVEDQETLKSRIDGLTAEIAAAEEEYERQREELSAAIVQQQLDAPLGPTVSLLGSKDADAFLSGLGAIDALNVTRAEALDAFGKVSGELANRREQLEDHQAELAGAREAAEATQAEVEAAYQQAQAELERLNAEQQAELLASNTDAASVPADPAAPEVVNAATSSDPVPAGGSGAAQQAIAFAISQLGDAYVYGGTGPDGWDCSGLTQAAFASAGVSIPRVVGPQINAGRRISMSELQPGDLVAYSSLSHIGLYIGDGRVIHAPRPGKTVEYTTLSGFSIAARVG